MKSILTNYIWLITGELLSRLLLFISTIYLSQVLGKSGFGQFNFALALVIHFQWVGHMGLPVFGTREIAANKDRTSVIAGQVVFSRLSLTLLAVVILFFLTTVVPKFREIQGLLLLLSLGMFAYAFMLDWVFYGTEKAKPVAISRIIDRLIFTLIIFAGVSHKDDILTVSIAWSIGSFSAAGVLLYHFFKKGLSLNVFNQKYMDINLIKNAFPLGISFLMIHAYINLDSIIIGFVMTDKDVGVYTAAYKLVLFILAFASMAGTAIFPVTVRMVKKGQIETENFLKVISRITTMAGLPVAIGGTVLAYPFLELVWGSEYALEATLPFSLLIWSVFTVFMNIPYATILLAGGHERKYLKAVSLGFLINTTFNFILIPLFGLTGAAASTILSELTVLVLLIYFSKEYINLTPFIDLIRPTTAACFMCLIILISPSDLMPSTCLGALVYLSINFLFGQIKKDDIRVITVLTG